MSCVRTCPGEPGCDARSDLNSVAPCPTETDRETVGFTVRAATPADIAALEQLMAGSARSLWRTDYTDEQIQAALGTRMEVDRAMILAGTYYVVEVGGEIVGCGGWSRWRTVFDTNAAVAEETARPDPAREVARIRGFFVHPDWTRRGIGRLLLEHCEAAARAHGFITAELMATLTGRRFYQVCGYAAGAPLQESLGRGLTIELVPMRKALI